jgi:hypothetical protein
LPAAISSYCSLARN